MRSGRLVACTVLLCALYTVYRYCTQAVYTGTVHRHCTVHSLSALLCVPPGRMESESSSSVLTSQLNSSPIRWNPCKVVLQTDPMATTGRTFSGASHFVDRIASQKLHYNEETNSTKLTMAKTSIKDCLLLRV